LKKELSALGESVATVGRPMLRRGITPGTKVPPKYRGPNGETWAGRGGTPVWMKEALKNGKNREDFLIGKSAMPAKGKNGLKKGSAVGQRKRRDRI